MDKFKVVLVAACTLGCCFHLFWFLRSYIAQGTVTYHSLEEIPSLSIPAITLGFSLHQIHLDSNFSMKNIKELRRLVCQLKFVPIPEVRFADNLTSINADYTLQIRISQKMYRLYFTYIFKMDSIVELEPTEFYFSLKTLKTSSVCVMLHSSKYPQLSRHNCKYLALFHDNVITIAFHKNVISQVHPPYSSDCTSSRKETDYRNYGRCVDRCRYQPLIMDCSKHSNAFREFQATTDSDGQCVQRCPLPPCVMDYYDVYEYQATFSPVKETGISVVNRSPNLVKVKLVEPAARIEDYIIVIGGTLGFWFGFSVCEAFTHLAIANKLVTFFVDIGTKRGWKGFHAIGNLSIYRISKKIHLVSSMSFGLILLYFVVNNYVHQPSCIRISLEHRIRGSFPAITISESLFHRINMTKMCKVMPHVCNPKFDRRKFRLELRLQGVKITDLQAVIEPGHPIINCEYQTTTKDVNSCYNITSVVRSIYGDFIQYTLFRRNYTMVRDSSLSYHLKQIKPYIQILLPKREAPNDGLHLSLHFPSHFHQDLGSKVFIRLSASNHTELFYEKTQRKFRSLASAGSMDLSIDNCIMHNTIETCGKAITWHPFLIDSTYKIEKLSSPCKRRSEVMRLCGLYLPQVTEYKVHKLLKPSFRENFHSIRVQLPSEEIERLNEEVIRIELFDLLINIVGVLSICFGFSVNSLWHHLASISETIHGKFFRRNRVFINRFVDERSLRLKVVIHALWFLICLCLNIYTVSVPLINYYKYPTLTSDEAPTSLRNVSNPVAIVSVYSILMFPGIKCDNLKVEAEKRNLVESLSENVVSYENAADFVNIKLQGRGEDFKFRIRLPLHMPYLISVVDPDSTTKAQTYVASIYETIKNESKSFSFRKKETFLLKKPYQTDCKSYPNGRERCQRSCVRRKVIEKCSTVLNSFCDVQNESKTGHNKCYHDALENCTTLCRQPECYKVEYGLRLIYALPKSNNITEIYDEVTLVPSQRSNEIIRAVPTYTKHMVFVFIWNSVAFWFSPSIYNIILMVKICIFERWRLRIF